MSKKPPTASRFIADSSPAGNKAGVRREHDTKQHGGIVPLRKILQGVLHGDRFQYMMHSYQALGMCLQASASVCAAARRANPS